MQVVSRLAADMTGGMVKTSSFSRLSSTKKPNELLDGLHY
jgi:hypothetical protein